MKAGHETCCSGSMCRGSSSLNPCYCDANCHIYNDCCDDVSADCTPSGSKLLYKPVFYSDQFPSVTPTPTTNTTIEFITRPSNVTAVESAMVKFQCAASPRSDVVIEWWFMSSGSQDLQLVADQQGPRRVDYSAQDSVGSLTLIIHNVQFPQNWGTYTCRVQSDSMSRVVSAVLTVLCKTSAMHSYHGCWSLFCHFPGGAPVNVAIWSLLHSLLNLRY